MSGRIASLLVLFAVVSFAPMTLAQPLDLKGKMLVISGTAVHQDTAPQRAQFVIEGIAGTYLWWMESECNINNVRTFLSIEYGPQSRRTGSFVCDQFVFGSPSDGYKEDISGSFTSSFNQTGNTLVLSGEAQVIRKSVYHRPGGGSSTVTTTTIRQAATIRFAGDSCEVVSFSMTTTDVWRATSANGTWYDGNPHSSYRTPDSKGCRIIARSDYKPLGAVSPSRSGR